MRLHRLTVTAFGPFGATQEIDFDALSGAGIFLLHGATGAGKTSVLDAVCFALYGAVPGARQSPGTSLRSDHAPAGTPTEVLLDLTVGGRRLEIRRRPAQPRPKKNGRGVTTERAQSQLREYDAEQGAWRALSRSHQEIGEEITQLVGMSREQFCQVVLLPQGDFARFLRSDAEARARLLGRLFDTGRFAAVEERLAERRRTAEGRVRTADEGLLAIAHRMEQAAGAAADDWPPPRQQPGDPGLADAVLEWAAVARAGAAERRDIAEGALTAAEHRQRAAREALESAQEEERLQRRYEDARRRRAVLEDRRPEYEELCDRLDRARRAERVAPALRLRDDAAREHTVAGTAYEEARALLPAELREAGAEQLAAAEARLRQDLGGLEAALRAERRSEEITRERAALDRQARADEEILQDAEGWLAGWEALRHGHQERIAAAQDAATRAEHLAGRLDPARRRLRAARERDRLAVLGVTAEEGLRTARDRAGRAREQWLDLKERRLLGIAAELAAELAPGRPCTVCGSAEHPEPARPTDGSVTAAQEDSAYDHYTRADAAKATAERELAVLTEALTTARTQARSVSPPTGTSSSPANGTGGPDRSPATAAPASGASGASGSGTAVVTPGTGPAGPVAAGAAARAGGGESGRLPGPVDSGRARGADAVGGAVAGGPANGSDTAGGFRVPVAAAGGGAGGVPVATDGVGGPDTSGVRTGGPGRFPGAGKPDRLSGGPACGAAGPAGPGSSVVPVAAAGEGPEGMDAAGGFRVPVADAGAGGAPVPTDGVGGPGGTAGPVGAGAGAGEAGPFGVVGGGSGGADGEPSATGESVPAPSGGDRAVGGSVGGGVPGRAQGAGGSVAPMVAGGGAAGAAGRVSGTGGDGAENGSVDGGRSAGGRGAPRDAPVAVDGAVPRARGAGEEYDPTVRELEALVVRLEEEYGRAHRTAGGGHSAREALDRAEREHRERLADRQETERRVAARTSRREALDREQGALLAELAHLDDGTGVSARAALLERRVRLLARAAGAVREADTAARRLKVADDRLASAVFDADLGTPSAAADALLPAAALRDVQSRVDAWRTEAAAVADRLDEPGTRAAGERPPVDSAAARTGYDRAERALREAVSALDSARERRAELARLSARAVTAVRGLGPLREEYDRVARLAGLTAGTSADNERRMRLESYVLAARLEQVAAAASVRLRRMSSGRFTLVHSDARSGGRRSGLGLHVVDAWTGAERDTATLSGGETFFASLALALGLADVVTEEAGGVRLDTLFVDEGFGSLDEQTLDEVIDVLDALRERDRCVGIVSHVADLRRRVPTRLEVVKARGGSTVRLHTAPLDG